MVHRNSAEAVQYFRMYFSNHMAEALRCTWIKLNKHVSCCFDMFRNYSRTVNSSTSLSLKNHSQRHQLTITGHRHQLL